MKLSVSLFRFCAFFSFAPFPYSIRQILPSRCVHARKAAFFSAFRAKTAEGIALPSGAFPFLHRLSGALEARERYAVYGRGFSLTLSAGVRRLRAAGTCADAARAYKRGGHLRFPPSDFHPLSLEGVKRRDA